VAGYRVLDIETVVDDRHWDRPKSRWSERPVDTGLHRRGGGALMTTTWEEEEPFPPPQAHRAVAMAWVDLSGDDNQWYVFEGQTVFSNWGYDGEADSLEKEMLEAFGREQGGDEACLVTWNGRTFDLPVVNLRSFLHGVPCEWYYKERDVRYRYSEAGHCDLMDFFSDYGAGRSMKLGDVAKLRGLPGKIGDVSGKGVGEIYNAFHPVFAKVAKKAGVDLLNSLPFKTLDAAKAAVGRYCLLDAMQTAVLFAESRVHKGMIDRFYYDKVVAPSFTDPLAEAVAGVKGKKVA
jgi:predicted PolB exonuclease-like 3'-5' exonuclease